MCSFCPAHTVLSMQRAVPGQWSQQVDAARFAALRSDSMHPEAGSTKYFFLEKKQTVVHFFHLAGPRGEGIFVVDVPDNPPATPARRPADAAAGTPGSGAPPAGPAAADPPPVFGPPPAPDAEGNPGNGGD